MANKRSVINDADVEYFIGWLKRYGYSEEIKIKEIFLGTESKENVRDMLEQVRDDQRDLVKKNYEEFKKKNSKVD